MSQSLAQILLHIIFSTKERYPFLHVEVRPELHAYAATILKDLDSPPIEINSIENHIHILCRRSKNRAVCNLVQELKTGTSIGFDERYVWD